MRPCVLPVLAAVLLMAGTAAAAPPTTHYRWKDASGVVHFSNTIPSSALADGYDIINSQGMVVRQVAPQLTPAQRKAAAAAAARAVKAKRIARQRSVQDAQLLSAYPTDKALEASQQAQLKQIHARIVALQTNLHSQEDSLTDLLAQAAHLEHADKPIPHYLRKRIADQRKTVNGERNALTHQLADLARTKTRLSAQLERYRTLRANSDAGGDKPSRQ